MTKLQTLSIIVLTAFGATAFSAGPSAMPSAPKIKMVADCSLSKMTWNDKTQSKEIVELAPASAKGIEIKLQGITNGNIDNTEVKFSAMTSAGKVDFKAYIAALDMFGQQAQITAPIVVTLEDKDLVLHSSQTFVEIPNYKDESLYLNEHQLTSVQFSTGIKGDGTVTEAFYASCELKVSK